MEVEAAAVIDVAAEPAQDAPPTPEPDASAPAPEGGSAPDAEGSDEAIPDGLDPDKTEAWLNAEADRRAAARAEQAEAQAEQRARQRAREADQGQSARDQLYATAEREARSKAAALRQMALDGEPIDQTTLDGHMNAVIAGITAMAARDNEGVISTLAETFLPDITEAEETALEPLRYDFRRNGKFDALVPKVFELALERQNAEIKDLKRRLGDREEVKKAAATLARAADAAGNGVGSETLPGRADTRTDAQILADPTTPISKLQEIRSRQRAAGG